MHRLTARSTASSTARSTARSAWLPALALVLPLLGACRPQPPAVVPTPDPASSPASEVRPSADLRGASDQANAPPAVGALIADNASSGGQNSRPIPPTGGDGTPAAAPASAPASGPSRPSR